ncbi:MAG TPA: MFS transporter [Polyangiaceae bacterium]|jgi:predicted MFS family arabinose efflux permease
MIDKRRILAVTFMASFAGVLLQRGGYFFTHDVLAFSQSENLWFALGFGVVYVLGAASSHNLAARFGERRMLLAALAFLVLIHLALAVWPSAHVFAVSFIAMAGVIGAQWPILESFMSAGETPLRLARALGRYNLSWALSVPPALTLAGPLIASGSPRLLFLVAAALYAAALIGCRALPARPPHLDSAHAERPKADRLPRLRALLWCARLAMLESYVLLFLLAPLMPEIMRSVGLGVSVATRASALLDVARVAIFLGLFLSARWHDKSAPLALSIAALPAGFFMVFFGTSLPAVVCGELLFGLAAGFVYFAALYYAQLVENASVDAGGAHEALIGVGYALGPGAGLVGTALAHGAGPGSTAYVHGMLVAVTPLVVLGTIAATRPLMAAKPAQVLEEPEVPP